MRISKKYLNPKTGEKYHYYDREGKGIEDTLEWAKQFEDPIYKRVATTTTWLGFWVSTVWLGLDHSFLPKQNPLIFETMVFRGRMSDFDMDRYTTEEEALAGHKRMVRKWSNPFLIAWDYLDQKTWRLRARVTDWWRGK